MYLPISILNQRRLLIALSAITIILGACRIQTQIPAPITPVVQLQGSEPTPSPSDNTEDLPVREAGDFDLANNIILYTTISYPENSDEINSAVEESASWALRIRPRLSFLPPAIFETFYGSVANTENIGRAFFNFRPQLSPNGRYILIPGLGGYTNPNGDLGEELWLVDLQAQTTRQLLPYARIATWNPESDQITYVDDDTLYVLAIEEGAAPVPLFTHSRLNGLYARWSPDGNWITVVTTESHYPDGTNEAEIEDTYWLISPSGAEPKLLTRRPGFAIEHVADEITWSADSQFVLLRGLNEVFNLAGEQVSPPLPGAAYWRPEQNQLLINGRNGLSLMTIAGEEVSSISDNFAPQQAFSHNGQHLAYIQKTDADQAAIFVFDFVSQESHFINVVSEPNIDVLRWSYDDDYLLFGAGQTIWAVILQPNSPLVPIMEGSVLIEVVPQLDTKIIREILSNVVDRQFLSGIRR